MTIHTSLLIKDDKLKPVISTFTQNNCERAKNWVVKNNIPLVIPNKAWNIIRDDYKNFKRRSLFDQMLADDASIRFFSIKVEDVYHRCKAHHDVKYRKSEDDDHLIEFIDESSSISKNMNNLVGAANSKKFIGPIEEYRFLKEAEKLKPTKIDVSEILGFTTPYFTPYEIEAYKGKYSEKAPLLEGFNYKVWLESYGNIFEGIKDERYFDMNMTRIKLLRDIAKDFHNNSDENKEAMLRLGWNPEVPFNEYNQHLAYSRINKILRSITEEIDTVDLSEFISNQSNAISENTNINFGGIKPVFIVFKKDPNSIVNKVISKATKSFWAHTAISFDINLKKMYSFQSGGFYTESIYDYPKGTIINVMCCFVPNDTFIKMEKEIIKFKKISKETSYNFKNLINCLTRKASENTRSMVCSGFTDFILKIGNVSPSKMSFSVIHPGRLRRAMSSNKKKRFYNLFKGTTDKYEASKVLVFLSSISSDRVIGEDKEVDKIVDRAQKDLDHIFKTMVDPYVHMQVIEEQKYYDTVNNGIEVKDMNGVIKETFG